MGMPTYKGSGTFVASASGGGIPMPTGGAAPAAGDILIAVCESENQTISLTTPNGFAEVTNSPQGTGTAGSAGSTRLAVFWKRAVGGDANPVVNDPGDHVTAQMHCFSGCKATGNPWNITAGGVDATSDVSGSIPGATTTVADCLVVLLCSTSNNATSTANFTGWTNAGLASLTERTDNSNTIGLGGGHGMATGQKLTAGAYVATAVTLAPASLKGMMSIALEGAGSAYTLNAEAGSVGVTGTAAALLLGHLVAAAAGSYAVTGTDAGTHKGSAVQADAGIYVLSGQDAQLVYTPGAGGYLLQAESGTFEVTGTPAGVFIGRKIVADPASYVVTGTAALFPYTRQLTADPGSFALTGTAAGTFLGRKVSAEPAAYAVVGEDVVLVYEPVGAYILGAEPGEFIITGTAVAFLRALGIQAEPGSYVLTGSDVAFLKAGLTPNIAHHRATVSRGGRNTGTVSIGRRRMQGTSVMDLYVASNTTILASSTVRRASAAPMGV